MKKRLNRFFVFGHAGNGAMRLFPAFFCPQSDRVAEDITFSHFSLSHPLTL